MVCGPITSRLSRAAWILSPVPQLTTRLAAHAARGMASSAIPAIAAEKYIARRRIETPFRLRVIGETKLINLEGRRSSDLSGIRETLVFVEQPRRTAGALTDLRKPSIEPINARLRCRSTLLAVTVSEIWADPLATNRLTVFTLQKRDRHRVVLLHSASLARSKTYRCPCRRRAISRSLTPL